MPIAISTLTSIPLFSGLPAEALEEAISEGQTRHIPASTEIMRAHTQPSHLVVVLKGQLQLLDVTADGRIIRVSFVNPGDLVGLLSAIDDQPIVSNVSSYTATDLILIPMPIARRLIFYNANISERVLKLLARHIRKGTEERRLLSLPNAFQRVFAQIASLSQQSEAHPNANALATLPKQHDIAVMVNTSRETVSRALQLLVKRGILVKEGHKILIRKPEHLQQLATEGLAPEHGLTNLAND